MCNIESVDTSHRVLDLALEEVENEDMIENGNITETANCTEEENHENEKEV